MKQTDSLGRSTFYSIAPQGDVRPTQREICWLKHIERHGPQSSQYLFELTRETHRCKDTALRQMQKLRTGGFLQPPKQQRATEHADFNPYVYDITQKARDHLFDLGMDTSAIRPTGHWWHGYLTSCVTSSLEIAAARQGIEYIPANEILNQQQTTLAVPIKSGKLIPDQLFALSYGIGFRAFALEVDRGTEPKMSTARRKSYVRSITQYEELLTSGAYRQQYGLRANLLILWVFNRRLNEARFLELVGDYARRSESSILTKTVEETTLFKGPDLSLLTNEWNRASGSPVHIGASND